MTITFDPKRARRPGHQHVRVIANVGGYFEIHQIIEVIVYQFEDSIGGANDGCMYIPPLL